MSDIAHSTITGSLDTAAKFFRTILKAGVGLEQLMLPVDNRTARANFVAFMAAGCPKLTIVDGETTAKMKSAPKPKNDRVEVINSTTIKVNLGYAPKLPFNGATIEANTGGDWVTIQKHDDGLYQDDVKIDLHLDEGQKNGKSMQGHKLRKALADRTSVHPNVIDAAIEHNLMPDDWKVDGSGKIHYIFSFAVVYRDRFGNLFVRFWYWFEGRWQSLYFWLGNFWSGLSPSALLAS
ncbi:MAG: hypothetical protein P4M11_05625 [Candidatus Pacebacteria bacterium]|nr:hypothetical protein [Candidatus Paceibacterota bacterium]